MIDAAQRILYSFRRWPYAIRGRLALAACGQICEQREVLLRDKPAELLAASPKGTVPVLVLAGDEVIDESLNIMLWALDRHDPQHWLGDPGANLDNSLSLIAQCDGPFKQHVDAYKYATAPPIALQAQALHAWLARITASALFRRVMQKQVPWRTAAVQEKSITPEFIANYSI